MKPILSKTAYNPATGLRSIIREIVHISDPEKILLLSASFESTLTESIYLKTAIQEETGRYYNLLVLWNTVQEKSPAKNEILLNSRFRDHRNLQIRVMDINKFNEDVKSGNEQANHILSNAMLWYDKEQIPLAYPNEGFGLLN